MDLLKPNVPSPGPITIATSASNGRGAARLLAPGPLIGILFLVSQVIFVLQTHFLADNPRLLTPVEGLTRHAIHATVARQPLTASEIRKRYGIPSRDDSALTVGAVRAAIVHQESSTAEWSVPYVRLRTREANGSEDYWLWPQE
jgi:hypothetical protein